MTPSLLIRLEQLKERLDEVNALLAQENATTDMDQYRKLSREHAELEPLVALHGQWQQAQDDIRAAEDMMSDADMKVFAQEELASAQARTEALTRIAALASEALV